jgi:hypothetical protein
VNLLLDTNILIPLEPTSEDNLEPNSNAAAKLVQLAIASGSKLFLHPAQDQDIARDISSSRRSLRAVLANKYLRLEPPPQLSGTLRNLLGSPAPDSNDYVDDQLIAAVASRAIDFLVTEDRHIHRKARRASLNHKVVTLAEALELLEKLFDRPPAPPPAVEHTKAYALDLEDSIWRSLRADYGAVFDPWLSKCAEEHRDVWLIRGHDAYAAVAIVKPEDEPPEGMPGKVLKLCTFKTSELNYGYRFGELLLKAVFEYAVSNDYDWMFVDAFPKHEKLINLFEDFGFRTCTMKESGEIRMTKPIKPNSEAPMLLGLSYNIRFGPYHVDWSKQCFVVPVRPEYHRVLFPDQQQQQRLIEGESAAGNAIRKAYLCHAPIKSLSEGALLLFYRSQDLQSVTSLGVVESTLRTASPEEVAAFVAKVTVYTFDQIREMCSLAPVLAIRFRHARRIEPHIRLPELIANEVLSAQPQSITTVTETAKQWIMTRTEA